MTKIITENLHTFKDWAYLAIAQHTLKFSQHEDGVLQDLDTEELHQMRVGMRKLRSAITGFNLCLDLPPSIQDKKVSKFARILGKLRDLDVLLNTIKKQYLPDLPDNEQKQLKQVLKKLKEMRKQTFKLVKKTLKSQEYKNFKHDLTQWLQNPQYISYLAEVEIKLILPDLLLPEVSKLLLHLGWFVGINLEKGEYIINENLSLEQVEVILQSQGEILHDLRKKAKNCRYQMELFSQFYGDDYQNNIEDIKNIQTILGDLQDNAVLTAILIKTLDKNFTKKMPVLHKLIQDHRYSKWQKWQDLHSKFTNNYHRQQLHQTIINPA